MSSFLRHLIDTDDDKLLGNVERQYGFQPESTVGKRQSKAHNGKS